MPFGISSAPEEFQRRMHETLEGLNGVQVFADDILVYGKGCDDATAEKDHDMNFLNLMRRCEERNLKLNLEKMKFKNKAVTYLGHLITENGLMPDPKKIESIQDMTAPTDVKGL